MCGLAALLHAQGGPPMITDDPGTPGPNHWEINLGWESERAAGETATALPLLDANYGVGDRIELTYETPWTIEQQPGAAAHSGYGYSLFGAKYRFLDNGDQGWQASLYPQWTEHGFGTSADSLLLPFEVAKDFGSFAIDCDGGAILSNQSGARGWTGGFLIGKDLRKGWEIDAEIHLTSDLHVGRAEAIFNAGTRIDFSEHVTLMLALGTDLANSLAPRTDYVSYLGLQFRL